MKLSLRKQRLRLGIATFFAVAGSLLLATPAVSADAPQLCTQLNASAPVCPVATWDNHTLTGGDAVAVSANLKVDDSTNAGTTDDARAFLNAKVQCFDTTGGGSTQVFGINSARNIWTGIGSTGVYPRAVWIVPRTGTYSCVLNAQQYDVSSPTHLPRSWTIRSSALTLTQATHGASTPGPNLDGWPSAINNVTSANSAGTNGFLLANQKDFAPAAGTSTMTIVASVAMSDCAYPTPDTNACTPAGQSAPTLSTTTPFTTTVRVYASQRTSPTDASFCGTPLIHDYPTTIDSRTHHFTVTSTDTLTLSSACTGRVTVKTELHNITGRGYIGNFGPNTTTPGPGFNNDLGATWN